MVVEPDAGHRTASDVPAPRPSTNRLLTTTPHGVTEGNPAGRASEAVTAGLAAIAASRTVRDVYHAACELATRLPKVRSSAILHRDERGMLVVAFNPGDSVAGDLAQRAAGSLHQRWIAAHGSDAPARTLGPFVADGQPDVMLVPMVRDDALVGALVLIGRDGQIPATTPAEQVSLGAIAVVTAQTLENLIYRQRLDQTLSRAEHDRALVDARKRLSRELHDGPTQDLALAGLALDRLTTSLGEHEPLAADARQARDLIDRSVLGMRKAIGNLRANPLPAASITGPLRQLLSEMAPAAPELEVDFANVSGVQLAPEVERALVGIVREALHNVRKHAHAHNVRLDVRRTDDEVEIAVIDDGVGFEGDAPPGHFGLEQIRELAEETGGRIEINPERGQGTAVRAWIPLPKGGTGRLTVNG